MDKNCSNINCDFNVISLKKKQLYIKTAHVYVCINHMILSNTHGFYVAVLQTQVTKHPHL